MIDILCIFAKIKKCIMIDISNYFCNNLDCKHYGLRNQGNIVKTGTYKVQGVKRQMLQCNVCKERFSETKNTIFFRSHYPPETIRKIINCTSEGNGVRATGRMLELSKDGVNKIVLKAGEHCQAVLSNLLNSLHLEECQLDELWTFVQKKKLFQKKTL
jgi:transposase-like protein